MKFKANLDLSKVKPFISRNATPIALLNIKLTLNGNELKIVGSNGVHVCNVSQTVEGFEDGECLVDFERLMRLKLKEAVYETRANGLYITSGKLKITLPTPPVKIYPQTTLEGDLDTLEIEPITFTHYIGQIARFVSGKEEDINDIVFDNHTVGFDSTDRLIVFPGTDFNLRLPPIAGKINYKTENIKIHKGKFSNIVQVGKDYYLLQSENKKLYPYKKLLDLESIASAKVNKREVLEVLNSCKAVAEEVTISLTDKLIISAKDEGEVTGSVTGEITGQMRGMYNINKLLDTVKRYGELYFEVCVINNNQILRFEGENHEPIIFMVGYR